MFFKRRRAVFFAAVLTLAVHVPSSAHAFDCAKPASPIEKMICASKELSAKDKELGAVYARAIAEAKGRIPEEATSLRDNQRKWIAERDRNCLGTNQDEARAIACLIKAYDARIAKLRSKAATAKPASAIPTATDGKNAGVPVQKDVAKESVKPVAEPALSITRGAASAKLLMDEVQAAGEGQALLTVEAPGRFSIRAQSKTGVALQLVDMISGPGERAGDPGSRDGRLDVLLDKGVYKIRTFGAEKASGTAKLTVSPFREATTSTPRLGNGFEGGLGDLEQRSFALIVGKGGRVAVEAAGRSLADLRLWRDGSELANLIPEFTAVEPKPGQPLTRARLEGTVEPGVYVVTAYGGEKLAWADGGKDEPFRVHSIESKSLVAGVAEGVIGPFGSERFDLSSSANYVRLELPEIAPAQLRGLRGATAPISKITKSNREPVAALQLPTNGNSGLAEVVGLEGQKFRILAVTSSRDLPITGSGPHMVSVDVAGENADELPTTAVLTRFAGGKATAVASNAPRLATGQAWRRKFNLRGVSGIIFEKTVAGPVAIRTEGPAVKTTIEPLLGSTAARADGKTPHEYNLEAGWYTLRIEPVDGAQGVLDLTIGQPGLLPAPAAPVAHRVTIPFGVQQLEKGASYRILTGYAPSLVTSPKAIALPVDLGKEAVAVFQPAQDKVAPAKVAPPKPSGTIENKPGQPGGPAGTQIPVTAEPQKREPAPLEIPVRIPLGGTISVTGVHGEPLEALLIGEKLNGTYRTLTVKIPAAKADRTVIISWKASQPDEMPVSLTAHAAVPTLAAGRPYHFNLDRDKEQSFELTVAEGGLYRVETLGRLKTALRLANAFLPNLANAADNGPGHNALLQTYLRAGVYRVAVKASGSAGHLGLNASPAPLIRTESLVPEGSVRASLSGGKGAVIPIEIAEAGEYRLDLYGLGRELTARLEDGEGWPLAAPGPLSTRTERLSAGRYRLVVLPEAVDARLVARLRRVVTELPTEGHGPHPLAFGKVRAHQWREPSAKDAPRDPDRWQFVLQGETYVMLKISEGMAGDLIREGGETVARITGDHGFAGNLAAGRYSFDMRSQGRNDRLDYEITLRAKEIQPEVPRYVGLPASIPFSIADSRVVSLTTFGREGLSASLRDAGGHILERLSSRTDDWNIAMSRHLPAGRYSLVLNKLTGRGSEGGDGSEDSEPSEAVSSQDAPNAVEVRMALPETAAGEALMLDKAVRFTANGVRQFTLPSTEAGRLMVVAAEADAEIVASLEHEENGRWTAIAFERGRSPALAWPADGKAGQLRLSIWAIDGGPANIAVSATALKAQAEEPGKVALKQISLDGLKGKFRAALIHVPQAGLLNLPGMHQGLSAGATPGQTLESATGGILIPQSEQLWLLSRGEGEDTLQIESYSTNGDVALALGEGEKATLPQMPIPSNKLRLWRADSTLGQPGLDAGEGFGAATGSALALTSTKTLVPLRVWNAGGRENLRLTLVPVEVALLPAVNADSQAGALLAPLSALPVRMKGDAQIEFNLARGTAAIARSTNGRKITVWAASEAVSRTIEGNFSEVLLINTGDKPAPAQMTVSPARGTAAVLTSAKVYKRFFGAAGSLSLRLEANAGDRLVVVGADATFTGTSGEILRGHSLALSGPGEVTLDHGAGLLAAWIERNGTSPWPSVRGSAADLPSSVELDGEARRFKLKSQTAVLLHVRTTSPVILGFSQGVEEAPQLYPAGAVFDRYLAPGDAELRLYSPHDGPLAGTMELSATPVIPVSEGLGEPVAVAPGTTVLFGFELKKGGLVGTGVRSEPDRASARLLDASGKVLGQGVNIITKLEPGRYFLEAQVPADGGASIVRPSVLGVAPPPVAPPAEFIEKYLEMAGMKQKNGH